MKQNIQSSAAVSKKTIIILLKVDDAGSNLVTLQLADETSFKNWLDCSGPSVTIWISNYSRVQRQATKLITNFRTKTFVERRKLFNLFPLKKRRLHRYMIQVFKILNNLGNVNQSKFFKFRINLTENNTISIKPKFCKTVIGRIFL